MITTEATALGLAPVQYAQWRRLLEERELRYKRKPQHVCSRDTVHCFDGARRLYGCLACGRSHACTRENQQANVCVPYVTRENVVCVFSGAVLDARLMVAGGSHKLDGQVREAVHEGGIRNTPMDRGAASMDRRHETVHREYHKANAQRSGVTRRRMNHRADVHAELQHVAEHVDVYHRVMRRQKRRNRQPLLAAAAAGPPSSDDDDPENEDAPRRRGGGGGGTAARSVATTYVHAAHWVASDDEDGDDGAESALPGYDASVGTGWAEIRERSVWQSAETDADDAYLADYLAPVTRRIEAELLGLLAPPKKTRTPAAAWTKVSTAAAPLPIMGAGPPLGCFLPWPVMHAGPGGAALKQLHLTAPSHHALLLGLVQQFLAHYEPLLRQRVSTTRTLAPQPASTYAQLLDRALALYNGQCTAAQRYSLDTDQAVARATYTFLTCVLTLDFILDDRIGTQLPVWVADPWLTACAQVPLFQPAAGRRGPPAPAAFASVISTNGAAMKSTQWTTQLYRVLKSVPMSVFDVHQFLYYGLSLASSSPQER